MNQKYIRENEKKILSEICKHEDKVIPTNRLKFVHEDKVVVLQTWLLITVIYESN